MIDRRATDSLLAFLLVALLGIVTIRPAYAAGCKVTAPNVHFLKTEMGRINFKPFVRCTTPEKRQLYLQHRVQYKSGDRWVTAFWTKNTLNSGLSFVRVSLSKPCSPGTFRGQARLMGDSGHYSQWVTSNTFYVKDCGGGGSWRIAPDLLPE